VALEPLSFRRALSVTVANRAQSRAIAPGCALLQHRLPDGSKAHAVAFDLSSLLKSGTFAWW